MTDITSGSKRPYEADREGAWKRRREDDTNRSRPRDWRDVHLRADGHRERDAARDRERDRERERERDRERERERERERDRDRDRGRDRGRERDRDRQVRSGYRRGDDHYRRDERTRDSRRPPSRSSHRQQDDRGSSHSHAPYSNGAPKSRGSDKELEEGEISPRQSPHREYSRAPSSSHTSTPRPPDLETTVVKPTKEPTPPQEQPPPPEPELDLVVPEEPSLEAQIAARRAKRAAILAKYSSSTASPSPSAVIPPDAPDQVVTPSASVQPLIKDLTIEDNMDSRNNLPGINRIAHLAVSRSASPGAGSSAFALVKEDVEGESAVHANSKVLGEREQISAADYDPSLDRREDEERRVRGLAVKAEPDADEMDVIEEEDQEEDLDDMFAIASSKPTRTKKVKITATAPKPLITTATLDSAADPEGYYQIILGEQLDGGRYQVFSSLGKGMFSNVVRARTLNGERSEIGKEVAIKIVRAQESMHKAGLKEVHILNKLRQSDPDDKKHVVRLERTFEHRGHLCLVFESLSMNLRDVIKRFGKDVGLNIRAVRAYTTQLFLALSLMRKCNIMHADIKPDNILVSENKTVVKLCDLGSASDVSENEITPYLVSRFYRAPEIILGLPYDASLDVWSIGCTLYELYTGKILFPGRSNNQMLLLMMELKGRFNSKMIKRAKFGEVYFDDMGTFHSLEKDKVTGADVTRMVHISKPARDLRTRVMPSSVKLKDDETKMVLSFVDLLDKCLALDPARRITPKDALMHPFVRGL